MSRESENRPGFTYAPHVDMNLAERVAARFTKAKWDDEHEEQEEEEDDEDLFSREDMQQSYVIQDARAGGYDVHQEGKHVGRFGDLPKALRAIDQHMEREKFFPNIYYVNDHGNVDLLDAKGKVLRSRV